MPPRRRNHPVISAIAIIAIIGGLLTMGRSLMLLHTALEQHSWPATSLHRDTQQNLTYRVGEQDFAVTAEYLHLLSSNTALIFYNPESPQQILVERPNFWWPLYLSMAGLIVFYAGLHLLREKDRDMHALGFE
jgi:chaperone required for assembly of F1-ATPase